jgi:hypothetical protein
VWVGSEYSFGFNLKFLKVMTARGSIASTSSDFHKFATDSRIIDVQQ